jgi:hypothetical protein
VKGREKPGLSLDTANYDFEEAILADEKSHSIDTETLCVSILF